VSTKRLNEQVKRNHARFPGDFIRLRRRPRALPVDECVSGVCANPEPRYHCFGGFRHWRITLRSLGACAPKRFGAQGRRRVFLWRYHGLSPWGSMFQLTISETEILRSQFATSKKGGGGRRYLPYAFTEQGVAMLSSVLNSEREIQVNIEIMRATNV
jgi:hypothetical protein